ncbi:MAG: hypothetical protein ACPGRD_05385 [Planktomarina sp.]
MRHIYLYLLCFLSLTSTMGAGQAQSLDREDERFWISREYISNGVDNCKPGTCPQISKYTTRLFAPRNDDQLRRMMALLDFQSAANGLPLEHPEAPQFCANQVPDDTVVWNPEWMQMSHKLESLRGLEGLHVDVSGLKAPDWYEGDFGANLQAALVSKFTEAGINVVDKDVVDLIPGKPKMAIYFSHTNPDTGCWWSVFATMTQTAILSRDINVKLNVGSWAFMKGYDPDNLNFTEYDAIVEVFDKFVQDYAEANAEGFVPVNVPPYVDLLGNPMTAPDVHVKSYAEILRESDAAPDAGELSDASLAAIEDLAEVNVDDAPDESVEDVSYPSDGFTPAATVPEIGPKTAARARARGEDGGGTISEGAAEKITTTGGS